MECLPDEILLMIFSYCSFFEIRSVIGEVCTRWKRLSDAALMKHINIVTEDHWKLLETFPMKSHIECLWIGQVTRPDEKMMPLIHDLANLTHLIINERNKLENTTISNISTLCPKLKQLDVTPVGSMPTPVSLNAISRLKTIDIRYADDSDVLWMADNCTQATEIIFHASLIGEDAMETLLQERKPNKLHFNYYWPTTCNPIMKGSNLRELRLYNCLYLLDLMPLVQLGALTVLHLTRTDCIRYDELDKFFRALNTSQLTELNVSHTQFCDATAECLAYKKPPLRRLILTGCKYLTIEGVLSLLDNLDLYEVYLDKKMTNQNEKFLKYRTIIKYRT